MKGVLEFVEVLVLDVRKCFPVDFVCFQLLLSERLKETCFGIGELGILWIDGLVSQGSRHGHWNVQWSIDTDSVQELLSILRSMTSSATYCMYISLSSGTKYVVIYILLRVNSMLDMY